MSNITRVIRLIHELENDLLTDEQKVDEICYFRDEGVITSDAAVDLVLEYNLHVGGVK